MTDPNGWLVSHLRPDAPRLLVGAGALGVASLVNFRTGAQLRTAIEEVTSGSSNGAVTRGLLLFGLGATAGCLRTIIFDSAAERLRASIAAEVFTARLLAEPDGGPGSSPEGETEEAQAEASGDSPAAVLESDVALCAEVLPKLQNVLRFSASVLGGTITMFRTSGKLSLAVWPLLVTGALRGSRASGKSASKDASKLAAARKEALSFAEERLQFVDLVRWFSRAGPESFEFRQHCNEVVDIASKAARGRGIAHAVLDFAAKGVMLGLCHLGGKLVQRGELTAGELTSFFFHASFFGLGLFGLVGLVPEVTAAREAARRLEAVVASSNGTLPEVPLASGAVRLPLEVKCEDVHFSYSDGQKILSGFSLHVPAGSTCALVGSSGCGKSTVVRLLLRDYDNYSGKISVGGSDVRNVSRDTLRADMAIMPQQSALLGGSVAKAIEFGAVPGAVVKRDAIEKVARSACAHEFVNTRIGSYDSPVGRGGDQMSGGERQRISMARALVRQSRILILDEPTSALDAPTASSVAKTLLEPRADRPTTIIATHSLALVRGCDAVAVLSEEGKVVQQGAFSTLIADPEGALAKIMKAGVLEEDDVSM